MKTLALATTILAAAAAPVLAQPTPAPDHGQHGNHGAHGQHAAKPDAQPAAEKVPAWMEPLKLTPEQRKKVAAIHAESHGRMDAAKQQWKAAGRSPQTDPSLKAEMQKLMDEEHAAFRAALAPSQRAAYDAALKAHMGAEHGEMKHDGTKHGEMKHGEMKHDGHGAMQHGAPKKPQSPRR